jgi:hypothetical protein
MKESFEEDQPTQARPSSEEEWRGFRFTAYSLHWGEVGNLPLTQKRGVYGQEEEIQTTLGEIYKTVIKWPQPEVQSYYQFLEITNDTELLRVAGLPFHRDMLMAWIELWNHKIHPFAADWFWYDRDSTSYDNAYQVPYKFFVVYEGKIARERLSFSGGVKSGFDPSIFSLKEIPEPFWLSSSARRDAEIRFWYRKFYTETREGQFMVLRDDQPEIYESQYHRGPSAVATLPPRPDNFENVLELSPQTASSENNLKPLLRKIHILLWVLVALGGLILIRLWTMGPQQ